MKFQSLPDGRGSSTTTSRDRQGATKSPGTLFRYNPLMHNGFARELELWGPGCVYAPFSLKKARAYCRRLAVSHYENFSVASLLLPRRLLPHFHAIYAYCRWADDLGDETGGGQRALQLLKWWGEELSRCYDGTPRHPVLLALARTIHRFDIPRPPSVDIIQALEQDQPVKP